jgi:hypothetical protein
MARRTGSADLPLHGGRVPPWLATRMSSLGAVITQAIVHHYGRDEFLQRLSHPFWFQSFGAVMGMDWHSSGITTSVIGALKRGLGPLSNELGIHVCGGRGQHSRKTPDELRLLGACPNSHCSILNESDSTLGHEQVFSPLEYRSDAASAAECAGLRAERPCLAVYR